MQTYEREGRSLALSERLLPRVSQGFNHINKILEKKPAFSSRLDVGSLQLIDWKHKYSTTEESNDTVIGLNVCNFAIQQI